MPILDVVTRWSSTHQMLRKFALLVVDLSKMLYVCLDRALAYRDIVDSFVAKHRELRNLELDTSEWAIITNPEYLEGSFLCVPNCAGACTVTQLLNLTPNLKFLQLRCISFDFSFIIFLRKTLCILKY